MSEKTNRPENVKLENVRLSFPALFKPRAYQGDDDKDKKDPKFSATFLISKKAGAAAINKIRAAAKFVLNEKYGEKVPKGFKLCLRDGAEKEEMEGYGPDVMFIKAKSSKRPVVVDRDRSVLAEEDGKPYAGCYVNATIRLWVQDNKFGKRVNAQLRAVQFVKDGDAFGDKPVDADQEFEDLSDDGSAVDESDEGSDII